MKKYLYLPNSTYVYAELDCGYVTTRLFAVWQGTELISSVDHADHWPKIAMEWTKFLAMEIYYERDGNLTVGPHVAR